MSESTHRALRLALASFLATALVAQLAIGLSRTDLTVVRFFSYFTVLSNTTAVVCLVMLAMRPSRSASVAFSTFRGAMTLYMTTTGLIYAVVLAPSAADVGLTEPWVDWALHVVGPVAVVADWIFDRPSVALPWRTLGIWLVFPAVYLVYTLVRGELVGWYPYPILDPAEAGGYGGVGLWSAVVLVVMVGFGAAYIWWAGRARATGETE